MAFMQHSLLPAQTHVGAETRWGAGTYKRVVARLRVVDSLRSTPSRVLTVAWRSQRLRSAVKRAMLTGSLCGVSGPSVDTYTPSASSSVPSDRTCKT